MVFKQKSEQILVALAPPLMAKVLKNFHQFFPKDISNQFSSQLVVEAQTTFLPCMEYTPCTFSSFKCADCFSLELYHIISFSNHTKNCIGDYFNKTLGSRKERKWKPKKKTSRKGKAIPSKRKGGGRKAAIIKINQLQTTVMMRSL